MLAVKAGCDKEFYRFDFFVLIILSVAGAGHARDHLRNR
jgi:hypothetical protein